MSGFIRIKIDSTKSQQQVYNFPVEYLFKAETPQSKAPWPNRYALWKLYGERFVSEKTQLELMAKYNEIMNTRILNASEKLTNEQLFLDKGAFFKSVIGSLNHIMIGDILWLKRFSLHSKSYKSLIPMNEIEKPEKLDSILFRDLASFRKQRTLIDEIISSWCKEISEPDLDHPFSYMNFKGEQHNKRLGDMILHVFLHQVHHRGQITTLLSQESVDFGETDLPEFVPDHELA